MRLFGLLMAMVFASPCFGAYITVARFERGAGTPTTYGGTTFNNGTGNVSGGEFRVFFGVMDASSTSLSSIAWNAQAYAHTSFCLELNEQLALSSSSNITTGNVFKVRFSDRAVSGGFQSGPGTGPGDILDNESKNIYADWQNTRGTFSDNKLEGDAVQQAIWNIEENWATTSNSTNTYSKNVGLRADDLLDTASSADRSGIMVMNVFKWGAKNADVLAFDATDANTWTTHLKSQYGQDQIIKVGGFEGGLPQVPEPATAGLLGLGMLIAGAYRARSRR